MKKDILLSLDMSTTCTGWALFEGEELKDYGKLFPDNSKDDWRIRVMSMTEQLVKLIDNCKPNVIIAEDVPTFTRDGSMKNVLVLGTIQGVLLSICEFIYNGNIIPKFVTVNKWRKSIGLYDGTKEGMKREKLKQYSVEKANELFGLNLYYNYEHPSSKFHDDDISDAILVGYSTFLPDKDENKKRIGRKAKATI